MSLYRERFSDIGLYENGVYDGIAEVLTDARRTATGMFVATSKPHVFAERIIDHFGLRHISSACSAPNSTAPASTNRICWNMR